GFALRERPHTCQHLRYILTLQRECSRALGIARIVAQQIPILFESRSTAGRVDHKRIDICSLESVDEATSKRKRLLFPAGVEHKRAATPLIGRYDYLAALASKDARRSRVNTGEEDPLHASQHQPDSPSRLPAGQH